MAPTARLVLTVLALSVLAVHGSVYVREMCPYSANGHSLNHHTCNSTDLHSCPYAGETCCGTSGGGSVCRYTGCDSYHSNYKCPDGQTCRLYTPQHCPYGAPSQHCRATICERQPRECPPVKYMPLVHNTACNQSLSHMQCPYGQYCCATYSGGAMCMHKDPCYNKVCSTGKMCQHQGLPGSSVAECVDDPCYQQASCPSGYYCERNHTYSCRSPPCTTPTHRCVPPSPCHNHYCPPGQECKLEMVLCVRAPCPPIARCVPMSTDPCRNKNCPLGQRCIVTPINCVAGHCPPGVGVCVPDTMCAAVTCVRGTTCDPQTGKCERPPTCPAINRTPHHCVSECNVRNSKTCRSDQVCCLNSCAGSTCVDRAPSECPPPHLLPNVTTLSCLDAGKDYWNNNHQICCQTQLGGAVWTNPATEHCDEYQRCPSEHHHCRNGQCWPNNCVNYPCPNGHICNRQTEQCVYYDVNSCPPPTTGSCAIECSDNSCGTGRVCCPTGCGGLTCVLPAPQHPCSLVFCGPGFRCNNRTGHCEPISNMCGGQHCPPGTECDWTRWTCVPTTTGQCPHLGNIGTCAITCRLDQYGADHGLPSCTNGRICCKTACGGTTCVHPVNTNNCAGVHCDRGHHCHPVLGTCVPNPDDLCATVRCERGSYCHLGQCIPVCGKDKYGRILQHAGPCGVVAHHTNGYCHDHYVCVSNHYMGGQRFCCPNPRQEKSMAVSNRPSILLGIPLAVLISMLLKVLGLY